MELGGGGYLVFCTGTHLFRVLANGNPAPGYGSIPAQPGQGTQDRGIPFNYNTITGGDGSMLDPRPGWPPEKSAPVGALGI